MADDRGKEEFEKAEAEFAFDWDPDEPNPEHKANGKHPPGDESSAPPSEPPPDPFRTIDASTTKGIVRTVPWLVKNVIGNSGLASLYGRPGCGKSFVAISLGLHIASGIPWRGNRVKQAGVYYFSMEAGSQGENRMHAALKH